MHASFRGFFVEAALLACVVTGACSGENLAGVAEAPATPEWTRV